MIQYTTIGKNYSTTLDYINNPVSEYFISDPVDSMNCATLQNNYQRLLNQITDWGNKMKGANKKSIKNLSAIIEIQTDKLDRYQEAIDLKCNIELPGENKAETDQEEPTDKKPNYLLYGAIAIAALMIIKK